MFLLFVYVINECFIIQYLPSFYCVSLSSVTNDHECRLALMNDAKRRYFSYSFDVTTFNVCKT